MAPPPGPRLTLLGSLDSGARFSVWPLLGEGWVGSQWVRAYSGKDANFGGQHLEGQCPQTTPTPGVRLRIWKSLYSGGRFFVWTLLEEA